MKVIGYGENCYICEVTHNELEKFLNLYYGGLNDLKIGQKINLKEGYNLAADIRNQYNKTKELIEANKRVLEWDKQLINLEKNNK